MPTPILHCAVSAAAAERAGWSRRALLLLAFAANAADLDMVPGWLTGDLLRFHHHFTHAPAFAFLLAWALSLVPWAGKGEPETPPKLRFALLALVALSHPLLDMLTYDRFLVYKGAPSGIMLLWPLSTARWQGWPLFSGLFISGSWSWPLDFRNLRIYALEAALGLVLYALSRLASAWRRAAPQAILEA